MVESTVLKTKYGTDFRKRLIHHQNDVSFNDLVFKIQNLYNLDSNSNIQLKYKDEDGDFITLIDDDDVSIAIHDQKVLYIEVTVDQSESVECPLENPVKSASNVATIDPSRHEQVESNGLILHAQEVANIASEFSDPPKQEVQQQEQQLENVPIDDKPVGNGYYQQQFNQPVQQKLEYQPPIQQQQHQQQQQQQHPLQPPAPQPIYGGFAPPPSSTPIGQAPQPQYPPHSTPSLPHQPPVSSVPYQPYGGYQPSSAPTTQAGPFSNVPPQQQQNAPQQQAPAGGFQPPPTLNGPPPSIPPAGVVPGGQAFNPFARGAQQPQTGAFNRPYGNY
ncbi:unnamed protein product [Bursaphelenchus xylophilus]|uniref:(pine wood nematode) hypothetical protein n=1 Tax=Bursaphelenchus xylophilus TaxID=6326 RepID=A0A1I7S737_BURXY|nr:unnamed protein product [Bursaphelenchus xylophilus]CAG9084568.1 unnamed protein product [Bursaphelenchus xylophilus]